MQLIYYLVCPHLFSFELKYHPKIAATWENTTFSTTNFTSVYCPRKSAQNRNITTVSHMPSATEGLISSAAPRFSFPYPSSTLLLLPLVLCDAVLPLVPGTPVSLVVAHQQSPQWNLEWRRESGVSHREHEGSSSFLLIKFGPMFIFHYAVNNKPNSYRLQTGFVLT